MNKSVLLISIVMGLMSTSASAQEAQIKILKVFQSEAQASELGERNIQSVKATRCGEGTRKQVRADEVKTSEIESSSSAKVAK